LQLAITPKEKKQNMKIIQYVPLPEDIRNFLDRNTDKGTYIYIGKGDFSNDFSRYSIRGFDLYTPSAKVLYHGIVDDLCIESSKLHYFVEVNHPKNIELQKEILKRMAADVIQLAPIPNDVDLVKTFSKYNPKDIVYLGKPNRGVAFSKLFNGGKDFYGFLDDSQYRTNMCFGALIDYNYFALLNHPQNQGIRDYIKNLNKENKMKEETFADFKPQNFKFVKNITKENTTAEKMAEIANNFINQKRAEEEKTIVANALKIIETAAKNGHKRTELRITPVYTTTETICDILRAKPHGFSVDVNREYDFINVSW
jgi:hypothetical protein